MNGRNITWKDSNLKRGIISFINALFFNHKRYRTLVVVAMNYQHTPFSQETYIHPSVQKLVSNYTQLYVSQRFKNKKNHGEENSVRGHHQHGYILG